MFSNILAVLIVSLYQYWFRLAKLGKRSWKQAMAKLLRGYHRNCTITKKYSISGQNYSSVIFSQYHRLWKKVWSWEKAEANVWVCDVSQQNTQLISWSASLQSPVSVHCPLSTRFSWLWIKKWEDWRWWSSLLLSIPDSWPGIMERPMLATRHFV